MRKYLKPMLWGFLVTVHLALVLFAMRKFENFKTVDSKGYINLAKTLYATGSYTVPNDPYIDLFRPPGYPIFLVVNFILDGDNLELVPMTQTCALFLTAFLLYRIGKESRNSKAGKVAALLYLINPNAAFWSMMVLSETLAALFLVLTIWLLNRYWQSKQLRWMLAAGFALGVCSLIRPITYPLWFVWGGIMLLSLLHASRQQRFMTIKAVLIFVFGVLFVVTPWQLRNYVVKDKFTIDLLKKEQNKNRILKIIAAAEKQFTS